MRTCIWKYFWRLSLIKKTLCETIPSPNEIARQAGAVSLKSPVLKRQHFNLKVVDVSVVVIAQLIINTPPYPRALPSKKIGKTTGLLHWNLLWNQRKINRFLATFAQKSSVKLTFFNNCFLEKFVPIFQQNSCEISPFFCEFVSENPFKFDYFPQAFRGPVLWMVYVINVLDLVTFFSLRLPTFFPSQTSIMSNLDKLVFKKSEGKNYIRSVKEQTKSPAI